MEVNTTDDEGSETYEYIWGNAISVLDQLPSEVTQFRWGGFTELAYFGTGFYLLESDTRLVYLKYDGSNFGDYIRVGKFPAANDFSAICTFAGKLLLVNMDSSSRSSIWQIDAPSTSSSIAEIAVTKLGTLPDTLEVSRAITAVGDKLYAIDGVHEELWEITSLVAVGGLLPVTKIGTLRTGLSMPKAMAYVPELTRPADT